MESAENVDLASDEPSRWASLERRVTGAKAAAEAEAREIARALTAHAIVMGRDAVVQELDERLRALVLTVWPTDPVAGYRLHASLGAYVVAKVAVSLVPAGLSGARHEPLRRTALIAAMVEHGVDEATVRSVIGPWEAPLSGFRPEPSGLDASRLAGLAERTLTRQERAEALSQVAHSPRDLARLCSTCNLLAATRVLLPVLPPAELGAEATLAVAALALGRPDRAWALLEDRADTLATRTWMELAAAQWALGRGQPPELSDDGPILAPELEEEGTAEAERDAFADGESGATNDMDDDVLEIVEERIDTGSASVGSASASAGPLPPPLERPRLPAWDPRSPAIDDDALDTWREDLAARAGLASRRRTVLGIRVLAAPITCAPVPLPPDAHLLAARFAPASNEETGERTERISLGSAFGSSAVKVEGTVFDPLFPPVRGALRAIAAAAEGMPPDLSSVEGAGDLDWVIRRARALALTVTGSLEAAQAATAQMPPASAPESRWAKDRALRYGGRRAGRALSDEARPVAAALVSDLAQQLARTIAGTVVVAPGSSTER